MATKTKATPKGKAKAYNADSIDWYEGLEAIRKRTSQYVSDLDSRGFLALAREIISNAFDEATNGHANAIGIRIDKDGTITVADNGRGIPIGKHRKDPTRDVLHILLTETHSGGKMRAGGDNYAASVGTYGVGLTVVNALSEFITVQTFHDGKNWHELAMIKGEAANPKPKKLAKIPELAKSMGAKKGTVISFKPDAQFFEKKSALPVEDLLQWIASSALFSPATVTVSKPNNAVVVFKPKKLSEHVVTMRTSLQAEPFVYGEEEDLKELPVFEFSHKGKVEVGLVQGAFVWSSLSDPNLLTYASGAATVDGGTHLRGFEHAIKTAFEAYRKRGDTWTVQSLMSGLVGVLNVGLADVRFNGQAKTALTSPQAKVLVEEALLEGGKSSLVAWLKANKKATRALLDRANNIASLTQAFKLDKAMASAVKGARGKSSLPPTSRYKGSHTSNPEERELFIVEGQSALGGTANARDTMFQEVLALTGKPENLWRSKAGKAKKGKAAITNPRIIDILQAIGYDPKTPDKFRVGKVIILTDADVDGSHISALLLGILQKIVPALFEQKRVFRVDDALFIYRTEVHTYRAKSLTELKRIVPGKFNSDKVTRLKGLGEIDMPILKDMALDVSTRILIPIAGAESKTDFADLIGMLGDDPIARKRLLGV